MTLRRQIATAPPVLTKPLGALGQVVRLLAASDVNNERELATMLEMIHGDLEQGVAEVSDRLPPR